MAATLTFFPVGNGDMTLIQFASGRTLLIDINIREITDDGEIADVLSMLKAKLPKDGNGRHSVDAFLLTHPDRDHCLGLDKYFYLGPAKDYPAKSDKILIRELWSSPMVFRRESKNHKLCDDAAAFNSEARRRVLYYRENPGKVGDGDRIQILGEDLGGKTDDVSAIVVQADSVVTRLNGKLDGTFEAYLLAPLPPSDDEEEAVLAKNLSSTVLNFTVFSGSDHKGSCNFLAGGDAEVAIWERLWKRHAKNAEVFDYDVLLTPHHCSWHSLSYDSWSEMGEDAAINKAARNALSRARQGAAIIASSKPILDDDDDPPCIRAKREYAAISKDVKGDFMCLMDAAIGKSPAPLEIVVGDNGPTRKGTKSGPVTPSSFSLGGSNPPQVDKHGGGRYA